MATSIVKPDFRRLARTYHVFWEVWPEHAVGGGNLGQVGFDGHHRQLPMLTNALVSACSFLIAGGRDEVSHEFYSLPSRRCPVHEETCHGLRHCVVHR